MYCARCSSATAFPAPRRTQAMRSARLAPPEAPAAGLQCGRTAKGAQGMLKIADQVIDRFQAHVQAEDLPSRIERLEGARGVRQLDQAFVATPAGAHGKQLQMVEKGVQHLRRRRRQFKREQAR